MRMEHKSPHPDIEMPSFHTTHTHSPIQTITEHTEKTIKHETIHSKSPTPTPVPVQQYIKLIEFDRSAIPLGHIHTSSKASETVQYATFQSTATSLPDHDQLPGEQHKSTDRDAPINIEATSNNVVANGFNLTPGPPPEIGYVPVPVPVPTANAEVNAIDVKDNGKTYHSISDRVKLLENSLTECHEPPVGGHKVFPLAPTVVHSTQNYSETMHKMINEIPVLHQTPEPIYRRPSDVSVRSLSPRPSAEGIAMEKHWATPSPVSHSHYSETNELVRRNSIRETTKVIENRIREYDESSPHEYQLKAPGLVKFVTPINPIIHSVDLEPGAPPEICYAARPPNEKRVSMVETIERNLEKDLERGPSKVLPCSVRTMPPSPQNVPRLSPSPIKMIKPHEWHSGYTADTEEPKYTSSYSVRDQSETKSAKRYFQNIDRQNSSPTKSYSPYEHITDTTHDLNHFPQKVRNTIQSLLLCAFRVCHAL